MPLWRAAKRLFHQATIGDQAYRFLFRPGPPGEVVALDCETTGLDLAKDDIITIAAVMIRGDRILASERFEATLRPDARMAPEAIKVHHVFESDVQGGKLIYKILPDFLRFIGGRPLVGYYLDFDVAMLDKAGLDKVESWRFADSFTERLEFEIDPQWHGELPYTLLIKGDGAVEPVLGAADFAALQRWVAQ